VICESAAITTKSLPAIPHNVVIGRVYHDTPWMPHFIIPA
jgi:hypothetical protein